MALNLYEAAKLSRNPLARGVMLGVATTNELISMFPWMEKQGSAFEYNREKALTAGAFVSPTHSSITEGGATYDRVTVPMRLVEGDVDIYNYTRNLSDPNGDPTAAQIAAKLKATGQLIQAKMITGAYNSSSSLGSQPNGWGGPYVDTVVAGPLLDSNLFGPGSIRYTNTGTKIAFRAPGDRTFGDDVVAAADGTYTLYSDNKNKWIQVTLDVSDAVSDAEITISFSSSTNEPDGLAKLISAGQTVSSIGTNGDALSFDVLDQLIFEKVKIRENRFFLMNGKLKRKFMSLVRTSGHIAPENFAMPVLGMNGQQTTMHVPMYCGIPILQVDDIPSTESKGGSSTLSSVYLVSLGEQGFHGGVQSVGVAQNADLDPFTARILGWQMYDVGQLEGKGAYRYRCEWFGAFALGSDYGAARASELVTA